MDRERIDQINRNTKEAWDENWKDIKIETILEIFEYPRVKKFLDIIRPYLPREGPILEAGCGLGPWVIKLGMLGYDMVGIDYQSACVDKLKEYDEKLAVHTADVRDIPFDDNSFNAYLSWGVIEHFAEGPEEVLKEARRVLKPGAKLVLTVPYKNIFRRVKEPFEHIKRNPFVRKLFKKGEKVYYYQKYFGVRELRDAISRSGFVIEETVPVDQIFSLVEFSGMFRDRNSLDGENELAVLWGNVLERMLPWAGAGSTLVVARKV